MAKPITRSQVTSYLRLLSSLEKPLPMRIELDESFLDVTLVAEDGTLIHRPRITVAIDTLSRTVLKAQVSEGPHLAGGV